MTCIGWEQAVVQLASATVENEEHEGKKDV